MNELMPVAEQVGALLRDRGETLAVAESSAGGLISAALLSMPRASRYFLGGAVVYTYASRRLLLDLPDAALDGLRPATEAYALLLARAVRDRFSATWGVAETGATGPAGNRYGDPPGHAWLAVAGPAEGTRGVATGAAERLGNMRAFARAGLELLAQQLAAAPRRPR